MNYAMFSDEALVKFRGFCDAAGFTKPPSPQGAFDAALPKGKTMPKYRFVPVPHCGGTLFLREKSSDLALDEAPAEISDPAKRILAFLKNKLDDATLHEVSEMLKAEAGIETDLQKGSRAKLEAAETRRGGAQDAKRRRLAADASAAASDERMVDFASRFPGAARIGHI